MAEPCPCQRPSVKPTSAYALGCRHQPARDASTRYDKFRKAGLNVPAAIDPTGTERRLQALAAAGHPTRAVAEALGLSVKRIYNLRGGYARDTVYRATADRVRALYDDLAHTTGPDQRAAALARGRGWAPPAAWDDDDIDNPTARPDPGRTTPTRPTVDPDDVDHLRWYGTSDDQIAARLGVLPESLTRHDERRRAAARKAS